MVFIRIFKKHCEDSSLGEYMNNIDEHRPLNNIDKRDRLLIAEDDYDDYIFPMYITKTLNQIQFILIYYILLMKKTMGFLYILRILKS